MVHDPRSPRPTLKEAEAVLSDTEALIDALFGERIEVNVSEFIKSIIERRGEFDIFVKIFKGLNSGTKMEIFDKILDKIVIETSTGRGKDVLIKFLKEALLTEDNDDVKFKMFEKVVRRLPQIGIYKYQILPILVELTKISTIKRSLEGRRDLLTILISNYRSSENYDIAGKNSAIIFNLADLLTSQDLKIVVESAVENSQIRGSFSARRYLMNILLNYRNKIPGRSARRLETILKE